MTAVGCATHQCDANVYDFYGGYMVDRDTFVTGDWGAPWLPFGANTTIRIWFPPEVAGRYPKTPVADIGVDPTPNGGPSFMQGDTYATASGQLSEFNFLNTDMQRTDGGEVGGGVWLTNGTCGLYYARVEVDFVPIENEDGGIGAELETDASSSPDTESDE
jgi:hypothetical protein